MGKEPIRHDGRVVGYVTSAAYGYSIGRGIAYGYLPADLAVEGTPVEIEYFDERYRGDGGRRSAVGSQGRTTEGLRSMAERRRARSLARFPTTSSSKQMHDDLYDGLADEIVEGTNILLGRGWSADRVLNEALVEGMRIVGIDFRDGILFVPEVLLAANAMKARHGDPPAAAGRDRRRSASARS